MIVLNEIDSEKSFTIGPNEEIEIRLPSLASAGYLWSLEENSEARLLDSDYGVSSDLSAYGHGVFHAEVAVKSSTKIVFRNARPWNNEVASQVSYGICIKSCV